jgi:hypothetical protein
MKPPPSSALWTSHGNSVSANILQTVSLPFRPPAGRCGAMNGDKDTRAIVADMEAGNIAVEA